MDDIDIEEIRPAMTWKLRQEVLYPNQKQYEMDFDNDLDDTHFGAFSGDELVAVVSVGKNNNNFQLRDFAIEPSAQNSGAGEALVESITEYAKKLGGTHLWTDASLDQLPLYLKYDFVQTGRYYSRHGVNYEIVEKPI
jgi:phosphoribosylformimino-5-aminoimidazole carboxamide ribotide isomerase